MLIPRLPFFGATRQQIYTKVQDHSAESEMGHEPPRLTLDTLSLIAEHLSYPDLKALAQSSMPAYEAATRSANYQTIKKISTRSQQLFLELQQDPQFAKAGEPIALNRRAAKMPHRSGFIVQWLIFGAGLAIAGAGANSSWGMISGKCEDAAQLRKMTICAKYSDFPVTVRTGGRYTPVYEMTLDATEDCKRAFDERETALQTSSEPGKFLGSDGSVFIHISEPPLEARPPNYQFMHPRRVNLDQVPHLYPQFYRDIGLSAIATAGVAFIVLGAMVVGRRVAAIIATEKTFDEDIVARSGLSSYCTDVYKRRSGRSRREQVKPFFAPTERGFEDLLKLTCLFQQAIKENNPYRVKRMNQFFWEIEGLFNEKTFTTTGLPFGRPGYKPFAQAVAMASKRRCQEALDALYADEPVKE